MKKNIKKYLKYSLIFTTFFIVTFGVLNINIAYAGVGWFDFILNPLASILTDVLKVASEVLSWILEFFILPIMTWVLTVVGNLLDHAINFSLQTTNINNLKGIRDGWKIFRDIINISFIFVLLYIAINTILGTDKSADKKVLANLVISALFINFSMFIAGLIIDIGNIVGLALRSAIIIKGNSGGLGAIIMDVLKLADAYEPKGFGYVSLLTAAIRILLIGISIYAIWMATVLFVVRIVSFVLLLILSPIGFVVGVFPKLKSYSEKWWSSLIGQSLVAPVFLFFFYVIAKITTASGFFVEVPKTGVDVTYYFNFVIVIGLILMAVKITKEISGEIGAMALKYAKTAATVVGGAVGGAVIGGTALAGRAVVGRGAAMALKSEKIAAKGSKLDNLSRKGGIKGKIGQLGLKTIHGAKGSSFDLRNTQVGKFGLGQIKGVKFGKGTGEGGYSRSLKEKTKKQKNIVNKLYGKNEEDAKKSYAKELQKVFTWEPKGAMGIMFKNVNAGKAIEEELVKKKDIKNLKELNKKFKKKERKLKRDRNVAKEGTSAYNLIMDELDNISDMIEDNNNKIKNLEEEIKKSNE